MFYLLTLIYLLGYFFPFYAAEDTYTVLISN